MSMEKKSGWTQQKKNSVWKKKEKKERDGRMHVHEKVDGRTQKKKKKNGRMHVHEKVDGHTKKKKEMECMSMKKKKKEEIACP